MDMKIRTPAQIFINGRFYCIANEVEIKHNDPRFKKSLIPDNIKLDPGQFTGIVINIKKPPTTAKERKEVKKSLKVEPYDEFFKRMVDVKDDPEAHVPVDLDNV
jgi:hypothetical protein